MSARRVESIGRPGIVVGLAGTLLVHTLAVGLLAFGVRPTRRLLPPMYAVQLIAAPLPKAASQPGAATVEPPADTPAPVKAAKVKARPVPAAKTPKRPATEATRTPPAQSQVTPLPGETPGTGTDIANVRLEGKAFPYPEYIRNIVTQIYRRWARPLGSAALFAEVSFTIRRDGTVREIKVIKSSRSYGFDLEAQGAVEQAAADRAFGPLPAGWPADILQVAFSFTPRQK